MCIYVWPGAHPGIKCVYIYKYVYIYICVYMCGWGLTPAFNVCMYIIYNVCTFVGVFHQFNKVSAEPQILQ